MKVAESIIYTSAQITWKEPGQFNMHNPLCATAVNTAGFCCPVAIGQRNRNLRALPAAGKVIENKTWRKKIVKTCEESL